MARQKSEYARVQEVARLHNNTAWVKRYHVGDRDAAVSALAARYGFEGRPTYMQYLCRLLSDYPDEASFGAALADARQAGLQAMTEAMVDFEVPARPDLVPYKAPYTSDTVGDCVREAWCYLLDAAPEGSTLVHGRISSTSTAPLIDHTWVELPGGVVYDGVLQRFYSRDGYYSARRAEVVATFSKMEALLAWGRHGRNGPRSG